MRTIYNPVRVHYRAILHVPNSPHLHITCDVVGLGATRKAAERDALGQMRRLQNALEITLIEKHPPKPLAYVV